MQKVQAVSTREPEHFPLWVFWHCAIFQKSFHIIGEFFRHFSVKEKALLSQIVSFRDCEISEIP